MEYKMAGPWVCLQEEKGGRSLTEVLEDRGAFVKARK
jgi:hypothetical protein